MKVTVTCSWCHEGNEKPRGVLKVFCWSCGHRADVPRVQCDCRKCRTIEMGVAERRRGAYREAS